MPQGYLIGGSPRWKFTDSNNDPLALGKLYGYQSGTSTPLTFYSNSDLSSAHTNPAILSASGEITVFVAQGVSYKFDLFSASNVQQAGWPINGILAVPAADAPAPTPSPVPTGGLVLYGAAAAPSGYLLCNGALISRSTYSALFTAIGTTYGAGDGSTTFGLPDLRGRFPLGLAASGTGNTLGGTGGAIDHTHTGPSHTHSTTVTAAAHTHTVTAAAHTHQMTVAAHSHTVTVPRNSWGGLQNTPNIFGRLVTGDTSESTEYQATQDQTVTSSDGGAISQLTGADGALAAVVTSSGGAINGGFTSDAGGTGATGTGNPPFQVFVFIIKT